MHRLQIKRKERRGRPIPRELRRAESAELELDLELGRLWEGTGGAGGCFGGAEGEQCGENGMGWLYIAVQWSTVDSCAGELVAIATGHGGLFERVGVLVGLVQSERVKEESRRRARGTARVSVLTGAFGRPAHVRAGARGGRRRGETEAWRDANIEAHRRACWGGPRVAGGGWKGAAIVRERTVARSRACKWLA